MKVKLVKVSFFLLVFVTIMTLSTSSFAYERLGTGRISGGASNRLYWRDSSIYEYRHSVDYGITRWNGYTSDVSVSRTTTKSYSRCDNYWGEYFDPQSGIIALTELMLNNQITYDYDIDWYWCNIKYSSYIYNYDSLDYFHRKGVACHEYGHFLGLAHIEDAYTAWYKIINNIYDPCVNVIMYPFGDVCAVEYPSTDDINGINAIY
jgi:hypothetical protein